MNRFKIGQQVYIRELQRNGRVLGSFLDRQGYSYQVRYFDNAQARTEYFYPDELEPKQELKK